MAASTTETHPAANLMDTVLEAKGLVREYGSVVAVTGVDLSLRQGDFLTIFGPNGAGKTTTMRILAGEVLEIARAGLVSRAIIDAKGRDETQYLEPLLETVASGRTPAEEWLDAFTSRWDGRIEPLFTENAY